MSKADVAKALESQGFQPVEIRQILSKYQEEPRWLKPSEVTEPGAYWVLDLRDRGMIVTNVLHYRFGLDGLGYKSRGRWVDCNDPVRWEERHRLLGPIIPPEYTGD